MLVDLPFILYNTIIPIDVSFPFIAYINCLYVHRNKNACQLLVSSDIILID